MEYNIITVLKVPGEIYLCNLKYVIINMKGKVCYIMKKQIIQLVALLMMISIVISQPVFAQKKNEKEPKKLIVIDAGHQSKGNNELEPIGPGAKTKKPKVSSGTSGVSTGLAEYKLNLIVAKKLKKELKQRGYQVKMIRTKNNVNISNRKRAEIANKYGADAFIRIHANSSTNEGTNGVLTISPTNNNPYKKKIYKRSKKLSSFIVNQMAEETGAKNRGVWKTDTMSGINWCKVPVTIVEMGFMSNRIEDKKLSKASYQKKIVTGIANGLDEYFKKLK